MKRKVSEIYAVHHLMNGTKMKTLAMDEAWALIKANALAKRVADSYDNFRNEAIEKMKPADWDDMLPQVQLAEDSSSDMAQEERTKMLAYRDSFAVKVEKVLNKEWNSEVEIDIQGVGEDALRAFIMENEFDINQASELLTFFM